MGQRNFRSYTLALIAGQPFEFGVSGNMYAITESTAKITITFDETQRIDQADKGTGGEFEQVYNKIVLESTTSQTVVLILGFGKYKDARASLNATVNATIAPSDTLVAPGDGIAGLAASLLIAAGANRKEVEFCLPSTASNPIRIGPIGVTANSGSILEPGQSKVFGVDAAWYCIRTAAPDEVVTVLSMEKP